MVDVFLNKIQEIKLRCDVFLNKIQIWEEGKHPLLYEVALFYLSS